MGLMSNENTSDKGEVIWRWWFWPFIISNYFIFIDSISNNIPSKITPHLITIQISLQVEVMLKWIVIEFRLLTYCNLIYFGVKWHYLFWCEMTLWHGTYLTSSNFCPSFFLSFFKLFLCGWIWSMFFSLISSHK